MERLPAEVCVHVLTFVPPRDIFLNVSLVCRKWHECTRVPGLFRFLLNGLPLYRDQVEAKRIIPASITDWEGYYKKCTLFSASHFLQRYYNFDIYSTFALFDY